MAKPYRALSSLLFLLIAVPAFAQVPSGLTATVNGTTVTLNWSGGGASSFIVEAALVPGGLPVATLPVSGTTLTVPNVPAGNYYVKVRAVGGAASNEILVSVTGGCPAPPLPPTVIVRSVGLQAQVLWSSSGGCAPTSYTLFAGSAPGLSNIVVVNAGSQPGLSTVAPPGTYYVRILGTNQFGSAMSEEFIVIVAVNALTDTVQPNGAVAFDVNMSQSGNYQGTLVWNDASIDLDFYLTTAGCPYPPLACLLQISDTTGTNTEAISHGVTGGQTYRLWVDNFSPRPTSFTIFNTVGGAAIPTGDAASDARPMQIEKIKPQQ